MAKRKPSEPVFYLVERRTEDSRPRKYLPLKFATYSKARWAREDLLKPYPLDHDWRKRIFIQHPNRSLSNPDVPGL